MSGCSALIPETLQVQTGMSGERASGSISPISNMVQTMMEPKSYTVGHPSDILSYGLPGDGKIDYLSNQPNELTTSSAGGGTGEAIGNTDSFRVGANMESSGGTDAMVDSINIQLHRLMSDSKTNSGDGYKIGEESSYVIETTPSGPKAKDLDEIMRDYGVDPSPSSGCQARSIESITCRMSSGWGGLKNSLMNISQNNETLESSHVEIEHFRRAGSSVDAEVGDVLKRRSKTSVPSTTHLPSTEEKNQPTRLPSDSNVDFQPSMGSSRGESSRDVLSHHFTFQKERERLRHVDNILKKTPSHAYAGSGPYQSWKPQDSSPYRYASSHTSDYAGKRTFSSTDYNMYANPEWRLPSSDKSYNFVNRTYSTPSYKNLAGYSSIPSASYRTEYSSTHQATPDFNRSPSPTSRSFSNQSRASSFSKSRHARSPPTAAKSVKKVVLKAKPKAGQFTVARKDKNMSKSLIESKPQANKRTTVKPHKSKASAKTPPRQFEHHDDFVSDLDRSYNRQPHSESHVGSSSKQSKSPCGKYQQYEPYIPERAKSEHYYNTPMKRSNTFVEGIGRSEHVLENAQNNPDVWAFKYGSGKFPTYSESMDNFDLSGRKWTTSSCGNNTTSCDMHPGQGPTRAHGALSNVPEAWTFEEDELYQPDQEHLPDFSDAEELSKKIVKSKPKPKVKKSGASASNKKKAAKRF